MGCCSWNKINVIHNFVTKEENDGETTTSDNDKCHNYKNVRTIFWEHSTSIKLCKKTKKRKECACILFGFSVLDVTFIFTFRHSFLILCIRFIIVHSNACTKLLIIIYINMTSILIGFQSYETVDSLNINLLSLMIIHPISFYLWHSNRTKERGVKNVVLWIINCVEWKHLKTGY